MVIKKGCPATCCADLLKLYYYEVLCLLEMYCFSETGTDTVFE